MTYMHHRYAIEAGLGYVGGMYHNIVVKGETLPPTEIVPAALQRDVLGLLMESIEPVNLAIPETLLAQLTPSPVNNLEDLADDYAFDHLRAGRILSAMVLEPSARAGAGRAPGGFRRSPGRRAVTARGDRCGADPHLARGAGHRSSPPVVAPGHRACGARLDDDPRRPRGHDARGARCTCWTRLRSSVNRCGRGRTPIR